MNIIRLFDSLQNDYSWQHCPAGGGWWSLVLWSVVVSAIQGHSAGSGAGGGTLAQKLAELCPPVSTQINVETGRKLK